MSTQTPSDNTIAGIQKWLSVRIAVTVSFVSLRWDPGLIHQEYIRGEIGLGGASIGKQGPAGKLARCVWEELRPELRWKISL